MGSKLFTKPVVVVDTLDDEKVEQLQVDELKEGEEQISPVNTDLSEPSASSETPDCIVVEKYLVKRKSQMNEREKE